jgi:hypothetical protein
MKELCAEVKVYPRKTIPSFQDIFLPYIVSTRKSADLLKNISNDKYPVLMEGVHCSYLLQRGVFQDRKVLLRAHNVEFIYYRQLAEVERSFFKKLYFQIESRLLKRYEKRIASLASVLCVSELDRFEYHRCLGNSNALFLPVFTGFVPDPSIGLGKYALYHGNLSVNENSIAAEWLVNKVVHEDALLPLVIAGRNPPNSLRSLLNDRRNIKLVENPSEEEMEVLIRDAHIHLIPSVNSTGIKLKLLHALNKGRFVICNEACSKGTGVESLCVQVSDEIEWEIAVQEFSTKEFTESMRSERVSFLSSVYNNDRNADQLIRWIY